MQRQRNENKLFMYKIPKENGTLKKPHTAHHNMSQFHLCRLCLVKCEEFIEITGVQGAALGIPVILEKHFKFICLVNTYNHLIFDYLHPNFHIVFQRYDEGKHIEQQNICEQCWSKTNDFHRFYVNIESKQNELMTKTISNELQIKRENEPDTFAYFNIAGVADSTVFHCDNVANLVKCDEYRMANGIDESNDVILQTLRTKKENGL